MFLYHARLFSRYAVLVGLMLVFKCFSFLLCVVFHACFCLDSWSQSCLELELYFLDLPFKFCSYCMYCLQSVFSVLYCYWLMACAILCGDSYFRNSCYLLVISIGLMKKGLFWEWTFLHCQPFCHDDQIIWSNNFNLTKSTLL